MQTICVLLIISLFSKGESVLDPSIQLSVTKSPAVASMNASQSQPQKILPDRQSQQTNLLNVGGPPFPPNFEIAYTWNTSMPLDPVQILMASFIIIYRLSLQRWNDNADVTDIWFSVSNDGKHFLCIIPAPLGGEQLKSSHLVLAIHEAVFRMYNPAHGFQGLRERLQLRNRPIAMVSFTTEPPPRRPSDTMSWSKLFTIFNTASSQIHSLTANAGEVVNPHDARFRMAWQNDGRVWPERDILAAIIDTLATLAPYDTNAPFDYVTGYNPSNSIVVSFVRKSGRRMMYGWVAETLMLLLVDVMYRIGRFGAIAWQLHFEGAEVGTGVLFESLSRLEGDNGTEAIAIS